MGERENYPGAERRAQRPAEVRLTDETIDYIEAKMQRAVEQALQKALTEETARAFWAAGLGVLRSQATQQAGRMVLGGLRGLLGRGAMFLLLGSIVYAIGGWALLAKLAKALFSTGV